MLDSKNDTIYGPMSTILETSKKYELLNMIIESVQYGIYMSMTQWKHLVKRRVQKYDTKRLKVSSKLYKSLGMINNYQH